MRKLLFGVAAVLVMGLAAAPAMAGKHMGGWLLDGDASTIAFGSVKKDAIGESHHFSRLSGMVAPDGAVSVEIDLTSVETWIDIRNERVIEHVFKKAPAATFTSQIDMAELAELEVGGMKEIEISGNLALGSASVTVQGPVMAVRLSEMRVMVVTSEMIWISTEEAGIDVGVTMLKDIAKLPAITRAFPVTLRLIFDHQM